MNLVANTANVTPKTRLNMELKHSKIVNKELKHVRMSLYGELGDGANEVNGHYWAHEFSYVDRNHDAVDVHLNGFGGSIVHGLSVVANILGATSKVETINVGVAASMLGIIALMGDNPKMNDYAKLMLHSPYYEDENGEKIKTLSAKDRKALSVLKDILVRLLMKRGKSEEEINKILKTDTWYSAEEALAEGFIDEIIVTGRKKELAALDAKQLVAKLSDEYKPKNEVKMKTVIAKLGLPVDSDEKTVLEAVNKLVADGQATDNSKVIDSLMNTGKKLGKVTDKNEAGMRKLAETDLDLFMDVLDIENISVEKPGGEGGARLSEALALLGKGGPKAGADEKTFAWFEQNDPEALAKMEVSEPEKFKKLEEADNLLY